MCTWVELGSEVELMSSRGSIHFSDLVPAGFFSSPLFWWNFSSFAKTQGYLIGSLSQAASHQPKWLCQEFQAVFWKKKRRSFGKLKCFQFVTGACRTLTMAYYWAPISTEPPRDTPVSFCYLHSTVSYIKDSLGGATERLHCAVPNHTVYGPDSSYLLFMLFPFSPTSATTLHVFLWIVSCFSTAAIGIYCTHTDHSYRIQYHSIP